MEVLTSAKSAWARKPTSETSTSVHGLALGCELCFLTKQLSKLKTLCPWAQPGCCWRYTPRPRRSRDYGPSFLPCTSGLHGSATREDIAKDWANPATGCQPQLERNRQEKNPSISNSCSLQVCQWGEPENTGGSCSCTACMDPVCGTAYCEC